jgi:hypothetical protein
LAVLATAWLCWTPACSRSREGEQWGDLRYGESDVRAADEQVEAQRSLQEDPRSLTRPNEPLPAKMFSQTMTEEERRRYQQRHADALRKQAEQQQREAERRIKEMREAQRTSDRGQQPG